MDKEALRKALPDRMPRDMLDWAKQTQADELGGNWLIFHAEWITEDEQFWMIMPDEQIRKVKCAEVTCTACGETYYIAGGGKSIWLANGEDGMSYTVDPWQGEPDAEVFCDQIELAENDSACCPYCSCWGTVIHASRLRGGRTKRIQVVSVEVIEGYAAIMQWMVECHISQDGSWCEGYPMWAWVLDEKGRLQKYARARGQMFGGWVRENSWRICSDSRDTIDIVYADWLSINNKKAGAAPYTKVPSLAGTTGEKTGLEKLALGAETVEYVRYLKLWRAWKPVEAQVNEGFGLLVLRVWGHSARAWKENMADVIDTTKRKPREMLGVTRAEMRQHGDWLRRQHPGNIRNMRILRERWKLTLGEYIELREWYGTMYGILNLGEHPQTVRKYLEKQGLTAKNLDMIRDVRTMAKNLYNRDLTVEELWPRDLRAAHERLTEMSAARRTQMEIEMYADGFREVKQKYGCLEWTDGDLCLLLPTSNADLIREGEILRHCVGGYGKSHISGKDTIFFVRHRRRPERPFYTLDINMAAKQPYEVQLHGYGNEHHGKHKEHRHGIPRKVREFCDTWKEQILMPYINNNKKENRA